jgi:pseudouridine synthase
MKYIDGEDKYNKFRGLIKNHFSHISNTNATRESLLAYELWGGLPSEEMKKRINELNKHGIGFEDIWIDAGWYGKCTKCDDAFSGDWGQHTGDWNVNLRVHPEELRDVVFPVGRLDKDTEGLLLITDDGELTFKLLSPNYGKRKTYFFYAKGVADEEKLKKLSTGVNIYKDKDWLSAPAEVEISERCTLADIKELLSYEDRALALKKGDLPVIGGFITITEGKKHQVKRMIRYTGPKVVYLKRISMDTLTLDPLLLPGEFRELTPTEIELLKK